MRLLRRSVLTVPSLFYAAAEYLTAENVERQESDPRAIHSVWYIADDNFVLLLFSKRSPALRVSSRYG